MAHDIPIEGDARIAKHGPVNFQDWPDATSDELPDQIPTSPPPRKPVQALVDPVWFIEPRD